MVCCAHAGYQKWPAKGRDRLEPVSAVHLKFRRNVNDFTQTWSTCSLLLRRTLPEKNVCAVAPV